MDFRKLNQTSKKEILFYKENEPNIDYVCNKKLDPSTCSIVIVYGGLKGCGKCKNLVKK